MSWRLFIEIFRCLCRGCRIYTVMVDFWLLPLKEKISNKLGSGARSKQGRHYGENARDLKSPQKSTYAFAVEPRAWHQRTHDAETDK